MEKKSMADQLREYFKNTPKEDLDKEFNEIHKKFIYSPDALEYCKTIKKLTPHYFSASYSVVGTDTTCHIEYNLDNPFGGTNMFNIYATAHLHEEDKFDEKEGKRISRLKAAEKLNWEVHKELHKEYIQACHVKNELAMKTDDLYFEAERLTNHFNEYLKK